MRMRPRIEQQLLLSKLLCRTLMSMLLMELFTVMSTSFMSMLVLMSKFWAALPLSCREAKVLEQFIIEELFAAYCFFS